MRTLRTMIAIVPVLTALGCAAPRATAAPAGAHVAPAPSPGRKLADEMSGALGHGDLTRAAAVVAAARAAPERARPGAESIAYWEAAVHAYGRDWPGAIDVLSAYLAAIPQADAGAFRLHDALIALRTAQGDLLGALVETEEMTEAGERGTWGDPDDDRVTQVRLKEHWHRAYLLRMAAETHRSATRDTFVRYAERARQDYVAVAQPHGGLADSIAVLDAYFAFCDGDRAAMLSAARRVNVSADDDAEDLYLVQLALDGGGDADGAGRVRERMRALPAGNLIAPIFATWMATDHAEAPRFSPGHPTAPVDPAPAN
ncbi:MAG: hypothetical protein K8W52_31040 [Deltaproteobacteria bacterium]|nr:hypothetical protein [Deltaproteobacteria bacterium]